MPLLRAEENGQNSQANTVSMPGTPVSLAPADLSSTQKHQPWQGWGILWCAQLSRLLAKEQWPYVKQKGFARNRATDDKVSERRSQKFLSFLDRACSEQVEQTEPLWEKIRQLLWYLWYPCVDPLSSSNLRCCTLSEELVPFPLTFTLFLRQFQSHPL